jgi:hypothetical protein
MKFFAAALVPVFAFVPSFGQYTFTIAGGDPPTTWAVQDGATNQVTILFDISQALVTGDGTTTFHVDTEECGPNQYDYSISPTPGDKVQDDADPMVVTFSNDQHIISTIYCIHVKLMIDDIATPVASQTFTYDVIAPATGQADVEFETNVLFGLSGNIDPGLSVVAQPENTVAVGQPLVIEVNPLPGFDIEITDVTLSCGTPVVANNNGKTSYPDNSQVEVTFPIACYADASRSIVTITLTVDWWVNEDAVRRLRLLQQSEESDGYFNYTVEVEIVPIQTNIGAGVAATGIAGYIDPGLFVTSATPGIAVAFGQMFTAQVSSASGFDTQIVGVAVPCGTPVLANNNGKVPFPTESQIDITLPVACFADTSRSVVTVTLTVDWWVSDAVARDLRELQASEELPDSGYFDYTMEVVIIPLEDGSSAYVNKFYYYCASAASAGVVAALLLE